MSIHMPVFSTYCKTQRLKEHSSGQFIDYCTQLDGPVFKGSFSIKSKKYYELGKIKQKKRANLTFQKMALYRFQFQLLKALLYHWN